MRSAESAAATVVLSARTATTAWSGDAVVIGAGLAGLAAAMELAGRGRKTLLVEALPVLGREVSREWLTDLPDCPLTIRLQELCNSQGGFRDGRIDPFIAALALDRIAEENKIECLVCALPLRPATDAHGMLVGAEIAGKSGRQLVKAPLLCDASPARIFSRRILDLPRPAVAAVSRSLYMHGCDGSARDMAITVPASLGIIDNRLDVTPAVWPGEALVSFGIEPQSPAGIAARSFQAAMNAAGHLRTMAGFTRASLIDIAPDCRLTYAGNGPDWSGLADTGICPLPDNPGAAANAVQTAIKKAPSRPLPARPQPADSVMVATSELTASPAWDLEAADLPPIPAHLHTPSDVVVAGCGTGGAFAVLAAADEGVSVTVLDPSDQPGGIGTAGSIHSYYHGLHVGMQTRYDELVTGAGSAVASAVRGFHPSAKSAVLAQAMAERKVTRLSGYTVFGVVREGRNVTGVLAAAEDGCHLFPCMVAIDATGDGDLAAAAGAAFRIGRDGDGFPQPFSYTPRLIRDGQVSHRNFDAGWVDPTDTRDFSRAHFTGRLRLWEHGPFTDDNHYISLSSIIGLRESRFITGPAVLTFDDFMRGRTWPDAVCGALAHYDNHAQDMAQESDWAFDHVVMFGMWPQMCRGEIPYRALYPAAVDGVLIACRALSIDHDLHQLVRMQPDLQTIGEICGLAAAMAVRTGKVPAAIDIDQLNKTLRDRGILPEPARPLMDRPADELLAALGGEENGPAMWRLTLLDKKSVPDWKTFLAGEPDRNRRFNAAVAAAVRGDAADGVIAELEAAVTERLDEPRLGRKSPARGIVAALALARIAPDQALEAIRSLLNDPIAGPMEVMLLIRTLGRLPEEPAAEVIRTYLQKHGNDEFAVHLWGVREGAGTSFRWAVELCAVRILQQLGCFEESHRLERYVNDESLLVRRYARRLREEGK